MPIFLLALYLFPFYTNRITPDIPIEPPVGEEYIFNGCYETELYRYYYGTMAYGTSTTLYDGLLVIVDQKTQSIFDTVIYETGYLETILFMGIFEDGSLFLVTERYTPNINAVGLKTQDTVFWKIDEEGVIKNSFSLSRHLRAFHNFNGYLFVEEESLGTPALIFDSDFTLCFLPITEPEYRGVFRFDYQGTALVNEEPVDKIELSSPGEYQIEITDGSYVLAFSVRIIASVEGVKDEGEYTQPVQIHSSCKYSLNGESYDGDLEISTPGFYELITEGNSEILHFTIHPVIDKLYSGYVSKDPVSIFTNATEMFLNEEPVSNGAVVTEAGRYSLCIHGVAGYLLWIDFEIVPSVKGLKDKAVYTEPVNFTVNGTATLNGMRLSNNPIKVSAPGEYELILWRDSEKYETVFFRVQIETVADETDESRWIPYVLETILGIMVLVGLYLVLRKKSS